MTSSRPYLIRAMHEWITDNNEAPHVIVSIKHAQTKVPEVFMADEQIVLNLSLAATDGLVLGNELIHFAARFNGISANIEFSPDAVLGIFSHDSGRGMTFESDEEFKRESSDKLKPAKLQLVPKPEQHNE